MSARAQSRIAEWQDAVGPHFDFLLDHGFAHDPASATDEWYGTSVAYRSDVGAVVISRSFEFNRVEVELARVVDGRISSVAIFFEEDAPVNNILLDNVLEARAPDRVAETVQASGLGNRQVELALAVWAGLLRDLAPDFLAGRGDVFDEAKEIIRQRVRAHPQRVEVWLPSSASPEEGIQAVDKTKGTVPAEVEVVGRRYRSATGLIARVKALFRRR